MKIREFSFYILLTILGFTLINTTNPSIDVFSDRYDGDRGVLADLPAMDTANAKLAHAAALPPFAVAAFGNSRILMVNHVELGLTSDQFFNFGLGGQSFRQSVRLLELLAAANRLPQTAVLSFDYPELGLPGGNPVSPGPFGRIRERIGDLQALRKAGVPPKTLAIFTWNNLVDELRRFELNFTYTVIAARTRLLSAGFLSRSPLPQYFGVDGSSPQKLPDIRRDISWPARYRRTERYLLLEHDLDRIARLAAAGSRIVIYESPIAPQIRESIEANLSDNARDVRRRLFAGCAARNLECFASPLLGNGAEGPFWPDATHAPAPLIAAWIAERITAKPQISHR